MRKLKRTVAKYNMRRLGLTKICKDDFFAKNWRQYVNPDMRMKRRGRW